ncbi:unnamed protein product, partial [Heterotrigona itama]
KDSSLDLSFSGHRARRKEEARQTAIEEGCNKWLIILWMGNPSKAWEAILVIILSLCSLLEFVACSSSSSIFFFCGRFTIITLGKSQEKSHPEGRYPCSLYRDS